jgi:hypothetical protein
MAKFTYNDIVRVRQDANSGLRRDQAWVVGIFEHRPGTYFNKFADGVVYTIEFEDGTSEQVHEAHLEEVCPTGKSLAR